MALTLMHYNFVRPRMALKFGKVLRTPAMQAGLVPRRLSLREALTVSFLFFFVVVVARYYRLDFGQSR